MSSGVAMRKLTIAVALLMNGAIAIAQGDPLQAARDLYASADYEQALSELARLRPGVPPAAAGEMDAYRAFCLVALGRSAEAEGVAESLLRADPMFSVDHYPDASPRVTAIFASVRKRLLPQLIRDEFKAARDAAAKSPVDMEAHLTSARQLLDRAEAIGAWDDTLADLRMLVEGFLELSRARPATTTAAEPEDRAGSAERAPLEFRAGHPGVVPPVVISQALPHVPPALLDLVRRLRGTEMVDVVIDEAGRVDKVTIVQSVNSAYDSLILGAARDWKYKPATIDGRPVRFVKTMVIEADAR